MDESYCIWDYKESGIGLQDMSQVCKVNKQTTAPLCCNWIISLIIQNRYYEFCLLISTGRSHNHHRPGRCKGLNEHGRVTFIESVKQRRFMSTTLNVCMFPTVLWLLLRIFNKKYEKCIISAIHLLVIRWERRPSATMAHHPINPKKCVLASLNLRQNVPFFSRKFP